MPGVDNEVPDVSAADGPPQHMSQLGVRVAVGGGKRGHVDGVADGLVAR